jgi:hypothetical protein
MGCSTRVHNSKAHVNREHTEETHITLGCRVFNDTVDSHKSQNRMEL